MTVEYRFLGVMSQEYPLIRLTIPGFQELQAFLGEVISRYAPDKVRPFIDVLEIGCGDGVTSATILTSRTDCLLTALDSEEKMIEQASTILRGYVENNRCRLTLCDALAHLRTVPSRSIDIVASALCLHNLERSYRDALHAEIFRSLKPGGQFVNADKYAATEEQRFEALRVSLDKLFEVFIPLGKLDVLRECVLHNVADQAPERVMWEDETVEVLRRLGFATVDFLYRDKVQAVLVAIKLR
jgi:tRNA (cmo5U34)-methyltransferase